MHVRVYLKFFINLFYSCMKKLFCLILVFFFSIELFAQVAIPHIPNNRTMASPSIKRPSSTNGVMIISSNPSKCNVTLQRFFYKTYLKPNSLKPDTIMVNAGKEITCKSPKVLKHMVSGYYRIKFERKGYTPIIDVIRVFPRDIVRYEGKLVKKNE